MIQDQPQHATPISWVAAWVAGLAWPAVVLGAYAVGGYVERVKKRTQETEARVKSIVERHMPAIHTALAEIRGMLTKGR